MKVRIEEFEIYQIAPSARIVSWRFGPTNEDLSSLEVDIYRSYSPTGDLEKIATVNYPQTYYRDAEVNLRDHWRGAYYRVIARFQGYTVETESQDTRSVPSIPAKEIIREVDLELKFGGMPLMVYLARKGARCPICWDKYLKKSTRTECLVCFGTSYDGGYYEPILTLGNIIPEQKTEQPDVTSKQRTQTMIKMSNFPAMRPKDIIYEVNAGIRWRIISISPAEMNRVLLVQELTVKKLNTGDVEHQLGIPENLDYVIKPHWSKLVRKEEKVIVNDKTEEDPREQVPIWR